VSVRRSYIGTVNCLDEDDAAQSKVAADAAAWEEEEEEDDFVARFVDFFLPEAIVESIIVKGGDGDAEVVN